MGVQLSATRAAVEDVIGRGKAPTAGELPLTPRTKRVLELALGEAKRLRHASVGTEHLLLGLLREGEGVGTEVLERQGVGLEQARAEILRILRGGPAGRHD